MDQRSRQLRAVLDGFVASDVREYHCVTVVKRYLAWLDAPFDATSDPTHVTASAIVVTDACSVVVHRHKRLGIYLQPGGHVDGDESPEQAAGRELHEETGLVLNAERLVHVDVHEGPRGHVHLDLRYLFRLHAMPVFRPAEDESNDVRLVSHEWIIMHGETSLRRAVEAALRQL
ncbi:MAG: NUDIX domain-containing protein [Nitriliruptoraceae bacterium]